MRHFVKQHQEFKVITAVTCDICGTTHKVDPLDATPMVHIEHNFGYESTHFGDCTTLSCDICEACLHEFLFTKGALNYCCSNLYDALKKETQS